MVESSQTAAYREDRPPSGAYPRQRGAQLSEGYADASEYRLRNRRADDERFDDGRFAIPLSGDARENSVAAGYSPEPQPQPEPRSQTGNYDSRGNQYLDAAPPHERGDYAAPALGRITFLFGRGEFDEDNFEAADNLFNFGMEFNQVVEPGGLGFEFGFNIAGDEDDNVDLAPSGSFPGGNFDVERFFAEIYGGARAEFKLANFRPYIGGGGTLINVYERRGQSFFNRDDEDDTVFGGYVRGGVQYDLSESFFIGVDFRRVFGPNAELFGQDFDTDYSQLAFTLGLSL